MEFINNLSLKSAAHAAVYKAMGHGQQPGKLENLSDEFFSINMDFDTLFVTCSPKIAAKIETNLIEQLKCGVIVSRVGPEFAFDFV